ncbi:tumor necrosis factor receptor superfamily member 10B isoform X1 [Paralichthys olivaceus]|uniref:tumor necrosis factor receptor superfamily member 10B isoform X1 n=1 Tax=Paralichthys olivaceus TaxID=8255 RepID=UPI003752ABF3
MKGSRRALVRKSHCSATFTEAQVFRLLVLLLSSTGVFPQSRIDFGRRTQRDILCSDNQYLNGNNCCLNCPAGTHVKSHCSKSGEKGQCQECDYRTYTAHPNELNQCFPCTPCRLDQEIVTPCSTTHDTECECKAGRFCDPHQACEVCKKCSKCEKDEEIERNCTSTTNTECKKIKPNSGSASGNKDVIAVVFPILGIVAVAVAVAGVILYRRYRSTDSQGDLPEEIKVVQCSTEERRNRETRRPSASNCKLVRAISSVATEDQHNVYKSLNSSASNSQHSLTGLQTALPVTAVRPVFAWTPVSTEEEHLLIPVNGEESLKKCFELFEEIEFDQHKRFFRHLGISDNVIKSKELDHYEDKIHDLLNIWLEQEGREASLNKLLKALLDLNQRRTAETVKEKAIANGHYFSVCL